MTPPPALSDKVGPSRDEAATAIRRGQKIRTQMVSDFKKDLSGAPAVVVTRIDRVPTLKLNQLRQSLSSKDASLFVVKNSLCRIAFRDLGWESLEKSVEGMCAVSPIRGEINTVCKILSTFSKDYEGFHLQGGVVSGQVLSGKELVEIGTLPSRGALLSQVAGVIQSPLRRLGLVCQAPLRSFVLILEGVKQKKSAAGNIKAKEPSGS